MLANIDICFVSSLRLSFHFCLYFWYSAQKERASSGKSACRNTPGLFLNILSCTTDQSLSDHPIEHLKLDISLLLLCRMWVFHTQVEEMEEESVLTFSGTQ